MFILQQNQRMQCTEHAVPSEAPGGITLWPRCSNGHAARPFPVLVATPWRLSSHRACSGPPGHPPTRPICLPPPVTAAVAVGPAVPSLLWQPGSPPPQRALLHRCHILHHHFPGHGCHWQRPLGSTCLLLPTQVRPAWGRGLPPWPHRGSRLD